MLGLVVVEAQASPTLPTVAGKSDQQITVSATGELRDFKISVPAGFAACYAAQTCTPHQFPLIILLHGIGKDSAKALSWFESGTAGNANYLTSKGAFFVAPLALPTGLNGPTQWRQITPLNYVAISAHYPTTCVNHAVGLKEYEYEYATGILYEREIDDADTTCVTVGHSHIAWSPRLDVSRLLDAQDGPRTFRNKRRGVLFAANGRDRCLGCARR